MPPHSQCHQCAAPLPPAAHKCQFCGAATAWGQTFAAHQTHAAHQSAEQAQRARVAKALSTARTGMILALVGLPICCGPLSLVGGVMGYRGASLAKAAGQPRPGTSVVAMVVAVVSLCLFCTGMVILYRDQQKKADHLAGVQARLQGKRESLDQKVACDLVEEYLVEKGYGGKTLDLNEVHCDGALAVNDRRATVPDVRFSFSSAHFTATACLEKRSRWFVLEMREGASCADLPPPSPFTPPPRQLGEAELNADEAKARADLKKATSGAAVQAFTDKLAKVRTHAASAPGAEKPCARGALSKYLSGKDRREVAAVDFDLFDWKGGDSLGKAWTFLSRPALQKILDPKRGPEDRAREIETLRTESGPLLVVYKADTKALPAVTTGKDYDGGEFAGWLFVYDVDSADRLCQTRLTFESSDEVSFRKGRFSSEKKKLADAVMDDFKDRFETAATDAVKRAAPDVRLGLRVLE